MSFFTTLTSTAEKGDKAVHDVFGYKFSSSPLNPTRDELRQLRSSYDKLSDEAYIKLVEHRQSAPNPDPRPDEIPSEKKHDVAGRYHDLWEMLKQEGEKGEDQVLTKFWEEVNSIPEWVDWEQIERGQKVFYRYAGPSLVGLAFSGLLGGMAAGAVVETLVRTGGFGAKVARKRM
jgi:hypothetical protein